MILSNHLESPRRAEAGQGATADYRWSERGEEVTLWVPLLGGEGARDIECEIRPRKLRVAIGGGPAAAQAAAQQAEPSKPPPPRCVVAGDLKGRADAEASYWVIEEEGESGGRELQIVVAKAGEYSRWDGVLIGEDE